MTEQIENAIEVVNKYLTWSVMGSNSVSEEQVEFENSLIFLRDYVEKTSNAWEEVLQELETDKEICFAHDSDEGFVYARVIEKINQHLAEIEE